MTDSNKRPVSISDHKIANDKIFFNTWNSSWNYPIAISKFSNSLSSLQDDSKRNHRFQRAINYLQQL